MPHTVILGAGLAGMATAHYLGHEYDLYEREAVPGGLVTTEERDGYLFDQTGHWLHMRDPDIRTFVEGLMRKRLVSVARDSRIYSHGVYTAYPFQTYTYGLPADVIKDVITGFIAARYEHPATTEPKSFEEWVLQHMGEGIAKHFMIPYNHKLWVSHPREMTPHWCQHYVPKPTLDQILDGALQPPHKVIGYNASFVYPKRGGIGELSRTLAASLPTASFHLGVEPTAIRTAKRRVEFSDGTTADYDHLVSSLPLPELIALTDAPARVRKAAAALVCNQVAYFNIALKGPAGNPAHWVYYPEPDAVFYRAGCYSNAVPSMAPADGASLYVEISHRGQLAPTPELWANAKRALLHSGYVRRASDIRFHELRNIRYAYVVFDHHYQAALDVIRPWLDSRNIHSIGRYGRWTYNSMETALIDGREIARRIHGSPA